MSGPYRPGYPGNGGTPFSPGSQTNQPVSFKTDINRKKTKKWVAAKSYSYDGDDWGDDDDDEEDEEDEEEVPRVTDTSRFAPTSQQTTSNPAVSANTIAETPSTTQAPGFVRPADIYRRIQEEKESDSKPHEFARSSTAPAEGSGASFAPAPSVAQDSSQNVPPQQLEGDNARSPSPLVIPEVKRLSGFGQDFFGGVNQPEQAAQFTHGSQAQGADQGSSLQHNPSLGFTSVVHQAFDVEETPNSSTGSFSRSNSGGTSLISPIISPWKSETDKTPTIAEDPTAEASAQEPPANFKPGHRRDMSLPSPGNGPDRVPTVINADEGHSAEVVQSSSQDSHTSSESPVTRDQDRSGEATPRPSSAVHESLDRSKLEPTPAENAIEPSSEDGHSRVPSPLQIPNEQPQHIPQVAPSFGTDESPHDMESDRLRKEIMRSFSSDHISDVPPVAQSQSIESEEPKSRPEHESTYLPSEYDSYWGQQGIPPTNPLQVRSATSPAEPATLVITPQTRVNTTASESGPISAVSKSRPKLKKKFSWEESEDSEEDVLEEAPVSVPSGQPMQPLPVVAPVSDTTDSIPPPLPSQSAFEMHSEALSDIGNRSSLPGYPADEKEVTGNFEKQTEEPQNNFQYIAPIQEPEPEPSTLSEIDSHILPPQTQPSPSPVNEASLPTFRKIMQISSPSEKIKVFNDTREQFAQIDTGLSDWIRRSSESLPEHADLIQANGRLPGGAPVSGLPPRAKFPKLSSLGNLSLPSGSSHGPDGSSSTSAPGHARRSSGSHITGVINRSNVESKGKDFLHSAGALGGKAGGAARGLFAKGKSKLRGADKGMSSIFRGQRRQSWGMGTGSDAQSSDLEFDHQETTNFSVSSRYSLQPVPRIPSLRLGDGKSFRDSFDGDEGFSMHARSFSADFGRSLRSVTEGEAIAFNPERISSLRRTVMSFDSDADESSMAGKSSVLQDRLSVTTASHGDDGNLEESLGHVDSVSVSTGSYETKNRDTAFEGKPKDGVVGESGSLHGAAGLVSKDDFSSVHDVGHDAQSSALGPRQIAPPLTISPEMSPPFEHGSSQLHSQVLGSSENNDLLDTTTTQPQLVINPTTQPRVDPVSSTDEILRSPVSPPLPQNANLVPPESANRRDSIVSQISEISQDKMDRIREKFDEDGIYADPSPTRSQVSDLTEDDDDDVDDALREKLDEAGFHSDLDKDAWEQFPRPPTAASSNQPIRVVRMTRFTINKKTAQSSENDTNRHSRFSFEGEGNTLAEAMLVNGHGRRSRQADYANRDARLEESRIPVTLGEDAPDKTPPPFPDPEAPYRDDRKEQQAQEGVPANNGRVTDPRNRQSLRSEGAKSPPGYRPIQSLPPAHRDALWKTGRLDNLHTHRDSIASSSVSSISNPNVNPNAPRMAVSPEPPLTGSRGQQRSSAEFRGPKKSNSPRIADVTTTDRSGWSLWANHGRYQQTRQNTSNGAGMSPPSHSNGSPGRHDEESLHSGDSTAVQAAASHQDLRTEPSPLMNSSETASNHSSHARMSTQFLSKVKFMGKRAKGTPAVTSVPPVEPVETKVVEKRKEKKTDGKKGALSRFGGIFNRSGPSQRTEETAQPVRYPQVNENTSDSGGRLSYQQTTGNQRFNTAGTSSSRHTSMPAPDKALPPPPAGYYAPSSKPVYEPPANYANQAYPQYDNASMNAYQPAPAQYAPNIGQYAYQSSPPFQPQPVRQPQQQQPPPPQHHTSIASRSYKNISPTINSRGSNASPELEQPRSRAQDLRMRSRSPRPAQMRTTTSGSENVNYSDPIYNLGKFHAVTETARIGDQSLPFPITLPDDLTNGQLSPRSSIQPEPAIFFNRNRAAAAAAGQQNATGLGLNQAMSQMAIASSVAGSVPTGTTNNNNHHHPAMNFNSEMYETRPVHAKNTIPIELPVPSENDEEEIVMSSTAYPGQEWQPPGFEQWMPY